MTFLSLTASEVPLAVSCAGMGRPLDERSVERFQSASLFSELVGIVCSVSVQSPSC